VSKTEIREVEPGDLPDLARFYAAQGVASSVQLERGDPVAHLHWFLFENPARAPRVSAGFIARDAESGAVAGALLCCPQRFRSDAREYVVLTSGGYYVDIAHRGLGLLLLRRLLTAGDGHAVISTTMNEASGGIYERRGGYPIPRTDHELLGVLRWPALVEELLLRRGLPPLVARLASKPAALRPAAVRARASERLRRAESADEIEPEALAPLPELGARLAATRSHEFLQWRYFAGPDPSRALYVYRGERGTALAGAYLRTRGRAHQIRTLVLLDLWGSLPVEETPALISALVACHPNADAMTLRGLMPEREAVMLASGFVLRALPRATGVCIDPAGVLPTQDWYLVPADGDTGH
jgi:hypothetical protein